MLTTKLSSIDLSHAIYNWLINFLQDRGHVTQYRCMISTFAPINASIVQGSGFGPTAYDVGASDLHTLDSANKIVKFADDAYLIIASAYRDTISAEFVHTAEWATSNNLRLNKNKSTERNITQKFKAELPPTIPEIARVHSMVTSRVPISEDLHAADHVESVLFMCQITVCTLRAHRLSDSALGVKPQSVATHPLGNPLNTKLRCCTTVDEGPKCKSESHRHRSEMIGQDWQQAHPVLSRNSSGPSTEP